MAHQNSHNTSHKNPPPFSCHINCSSLPSRPFCEQSQHTSELPVPLSCEQSSEMLPTTDNIQNSITRMLDSLVFSISYYYTIQRAI